MKSWMGGERKRVDRERNSEVGIQKRFFAKMRGGNQFPVVLKPKAQTSSFLSKDIVNMNALDHFAFRGRTGSFGSSPGALASSNPVRIFDNGKEKTRRYGAPLPDGAGSHGDRPGTATTVVQRAAEQKKKEVWSQRPPLDSKTAKNASSDASQRGEPLEPLALRLGFSAEQPLDIERRDNKFSMEPVHPPSIVFPMAARADGPEPDFMRLERPVREALPPRFHESPNIDRPRTISDSVDNLRKTSNVASSFKVGTGLSMVQSSALDQPPMEENGTVSRFQPSRLSDTVFGNHLCMPALGKTLGGSHFFWHPTEDAAVQPARLGDMRIDANSKLGQGIPREFLQLNTATEPAKGVDMQLLRTTPRDDVTQPKNVVSKGGDLRNPSALPKVLEVRRNSPQFSETVADPALSALVKPNNGIDLFLGQTKESETLKRKEKLIFLLDDSGFAVSPSAKRPPPNPHKKSRVDAVDIKEHLNECPRDDAHQAWKESDVLPSDKQVSLASARMTTASKSALTLIDPEPKTSVLQESPSTTAKFPLQSPRGALNVANGASPSPGPDAAPAFTFSISRNLDRQLAECGLEAQVANIDFAPKQLVAAQEPFLTKGVQTEHAADLEHRIHKLELKLEALSCEVKRFSQNKTEFPVSPAGCQTEGGTTSNQKYAEHSQYKKLSSGPATFGSRDTTRTNQDNMCTTLSAPIFTSIIVNPSQLHSGRSEAGMPSISVMNQSHPAESSAAQAEVQAAVENLSRHQSRDGSLESLPHENSNMQGEPGTEHDVATRQSDTDGIPSLAAVDHFIANHSLLPCLEIEADQCKELSSEFDTFEHTEVVRIDQGSMLETLAVATRNSLMNGQHSHRSLGNNLKVETAEHDPGASSSCEQETCSVKLGEASEAASVPAADVLIVDLSSGVKSEILNQTKAVLAPVQPLAAQAEPSLAACEISEKPLAPTDVAVGPVDQVDSAFPKVFEHRTWASKADIAAVSVTDAKHNSPMPADIARSSLSAAKSNRAHDCQGEPGISDMAKDVDIRYTSNSEIDPDTCLVYDEDELVMDASDMDFFDPTDL